MSAGLGVRFFSRTSTVFPVKSTSATSRPQNLRPPGPGMGGEAEERVNPRVRGLFLDVGEQLGQFAGLQVKRLPKRSPGRRLRPVCRSISAIVMKGGFSSVLGKRSPRFGNLPEVSPIGSPQFQAARSVAISLRMVTGLSFALARWSDIFLHLGNRQFADREAFAEDADKVAEVQFAGIEAVGLDGAVAVGGEVAVFQVAEGDDLPWGIGQRRPCLGRLAVMLDEGDDVGAIGQDRSALASAASAGNRPAGIYSRLRPSRLYQW